MLVCPVEMTHSASGLPECTDIIILGLTTYLVTVKMLQNHCCFTSGCGLANLMFPSSACFTLLRFVIVASAVCSTSPLSHCSFSSLDVPYQLDSIRTATKHRFASCAGTDNIGAQFRQSGLGFLKGNIPQAAREALSAIVASRK